MKQALTTFLTISLILIAGLLIGLIAIPYAALLYSGVLK